MASSPDEPRPDPTEQDQPAEGGEVAESDAPPPRRATHAPTPEQARENAERESPA